MSESRRSGHLERRWVEGEPTDAKTLPTPGLRQGGGPRNAQRYDPSRNWNEKTQPPTPEPTRKMGFGGLTLASPMARIPPTITGPSAAQGRRRSGGRLGCQSAVFGGSLKMARWHHRSCCQLEFSWRREHCAGRGPTGSRWVECVRGGVKKGPEPARFRFALGKSPGLAVSGSGRCVQKHTRANVKCTTSRRKEKFQLVRA